VSKAALESSGLTGSGQFLGTVDYAAPEQIQGKAVDGRTDQYALGCAAYELLCGRPPFAGRELLAAMYAQLSEPPPAPSQVRAGLSAAVDEVFARVLAKSPDDRYESCQDFARALRAALGVQHYEVDRSAEAAQGSGGGVAGDDATLDPALVRSQPAGGEATLGTARTGGSLTLERPATGGTLPGFGTGDGAGLWDGPGARTRGYPSARKVLAAVAAAVIVLAAVVVAVLLHGHTALPASPYYMRAKAYPGNLAVSQRWQLEGARGSLLDVTIIASNGSAKPVTAQLEEPIPAAVATSTNHVSFTGSGHPRMPLAHVVAWDLSLPGKGRITVGYKVPEPADGATEARLQHWVRAFKLVSGQQDLERVKPGPSVLKYLVINPDDIQLHAGDSYPVRLSGLTSDARRASARQLSKVKWSSQNDAIATVDHGVIYAQSPGQTRVTARIGSVTATAVVTVVASSGGQPGPVYSSPGGPTSPPSSTSPTTSTSASPSPSSSDTGSPTTSTSTSPSPPPTGSPSPQSS
jgi:hypothetical protein